MVKPIPKPVIRLLDEAWQSAQPNYSAFKSVFEDYPDRRVDPSYYHYGNDSLERDNNGLRGKEVVALNREALFAPFIHQSKHGYAINEHAQHALVDFCEEVYASWDKLQARLARVEPR